MVQSSAAVSLSSRTFLPSCCRSRHENYNCYYYDDDDDDYYYYYDMMVVVMLLPSIMIIVYSCLFLFLTARIAPLPLCPSAPPSLPFPSPVAPDLSTDKLFYGYPVPRAFPITYMNRSSCLTRSFSHHHSTSTFDQPLTLSQDSASMPIPILPHSSPFFFIRIPIRIPNLSLGMLHIS